MRQLRARRGAWLVVCAITSGFGGCLDSEDSCGPNMQYVHARGVCVCNDNAIAEGGGCKTCALDEVVVEAACGCPDGEAKDADNLCAPLPGFNEIGPARYSQ